MRNVKLTRVALGVAAASALVGLVIARNQSLAPARSAVAQAVPEKADSAPLVPLPDGFPGIELPAVGTTTLRIVSPTVLELERITTKDLDPAPVQDWDFVRDGAVTQCGHVAMVGPAELQDPKLPTAENFVVNVVDANGTVTQTLPVAKVGFKRRVIYAPRRSYDLRIGNQLYLVLAQPLPADATVTVDDNSGKLWAKPTPFVAKMNRMRYSPAIHVNQSGYEPNLPKRAMVGYYLGDLGELPFDPSPTFSVVEAATGKEVLAGLALNPRKDSGFQIAPIPYQRVFEADFSALTTPGEYQLVVPGMGASYPFVVEDGVTMAFVRTFAQGLYNQRCGTAKTVPYTRFVDDADHTAPAAVPTTTDPAYANTAQMILDNSCPGKPAPCPPAGAGRQLTGVDASLYPFIRTGPIDVSGGHHDAGDYSKYIFNSARLIHTLVFAADSMPDVGKLDNLGIPESGDNKSDVLQEAMWEADFLANAQDADGGFYVLVYPRDSAYEDKVLPSKGSPQVVWPKNTLATAAAVAALAEIGSSPRFKAQYPDVAPKYLHAAQTGWEFLKKAIKNFGKDGSYQYLYHYGAEFNHDDELAWAAAAIFVATGDPDAWAQLQTSLPDPNTPTTFRYGWQQLWEGYGNAIRDIAFAEISGRMQAGRVDAKYLAACKTAIKNGADRVVCWAKHSAYGTSFPDQSKAYHGAGWYFSPTQAFDLAVGHALAADPANAVALTTHANYAVDAVTDANYVDAILTNFNYECGTNPLNKSYLSGLGWRRPREMVSQFFQNDRHRLPPTGIDFGNFVSGFDMYDPYCRTFAARNADCGMANRLSYPTEDCFAFYDRSADAYLIRSESVTVNEAQGFAAIASIAAQTSAAKALWTAQAGKLTVTGQLQVGQPVTVRLDYAGLDLRRARVTWEGLDQEPAIGGTSWTFTPRHVGAQWIDAEAVLPDGRRVIAVLNNLSAFEVVENQTIEHFNPGTDLAHATNIVAWYPLDGDFEDHGPLNAGASVCAAGAVGCRTLGRTGNPEFDSTTFHWNNRPHGAALRVHDLGDGASVTIPPPATEWQAVSIEALLYVNAWKKPAIGDVNVCAVESTWNTKLGLSENMYAGPQARGGNGSTFTWAAAPPHAVLTTREWHHVRVLLDTNGYSVWVDGVQLSFVQSPDLANWKGARQNKQQLTITIGDFDGWIDEVVVKNAQ